jgi:hypothetical protein
MPKAKSDNQLFWDGNKLHWMKETGLPTSRTVLEAVRQAATKWNRKLNSRNFERKFIEKYGHSPGKYLATKLALMPDHLPDVPPLENPAYLRGEINRLEKELRVAHEQSKIAVMVKSLLQGALDRKAEPPRWLIDGPKSSKLFHGVPTLFLSDIHHGETVFPAQVNGANQFNPEISRKRLERVFKKTIYLIENVFTKADYPGIVLAMGGDMVSGNIHEELRETNEIPIFDAVLDLADILEAGIKMLRARFKHVFIPCVVGNHGRLDKKPRAKHGPHDNFEYILYHYLASRFKDDDRVTFMVSDSFTCHYRIYGTRYLLTHGDCFKGGTGIQGPLLPWTLGEHRMRKQMQTMSAWTKMPTEFDVMIFGHWHTYFPARTFVANGSVKGFDEFAKKIGVPFDPPQQALWMTNPEYGMTFNAPVIAVESNVTDKDTTDWVSLPSKK